MPGYGICDICEERCWENLHWLADHWADLEDQLAAPDRPADGMPRSRSDATGIVINDKVAELRRKVHDTLRYWSQVVLDENPGFTGPKDDPVSLARYLARQHRRITRHHDAGLAAALPIDVHDLRREVFKRAFPSGARLWTPEPEIPCKETTEDGPCPGQYQTVVHDRMDGVPDLHCSIDRTHLLTPAEFRRVGRQTMKGEAAMRLVQAIKEGAA